MITEDTGTPSENRLRSAYRMVVRISAVLLLAYGIHMLMGWISGFDFQDAGMIRVGVLVLFLLAYALLISIPFVPGVELGLSLMVMEGHWITPFIYASTVLGLSLSYGVGLWVPYPRLRRLFMDMRLKKTGQMIDDIAPMDRDQRLEALRAKVPTWLSPVASRFRYLLLAIVINLPGNSVVGGGGGLVFLAGLSRLFAPFQTVLTIMVAVAPVPIAVWVFNIDLSGYL